MDGECPMAWGFVSHHFQESVGDYIYIYIYTVYITMENHHSINGKTHYFYDRFQQQAVSLPEGI